MTESYAPPTNEAGNNSQLTDVMTRLLDPQYLAGVRSTLAQQEKDPTFEGRYVAGQLLGTMETNQASLALRSSDPGASDVMQGVKVAPLLPERHLLPVRELDSNGDWTQRISIQSFEDDPTLELPLANFVAADGLQDWATGRGDDVIKIEEGTRVARTSEKTIKEYAKHTTKAPPLESVVGYVQPNGIILFVTAQGAHRTAAAIARGDHTIETKNLTLIPLDKDLLA